MVDRNVTRYINNNYTNINYNLFNGTVISRILRNHHQLAIYCNWNKLKGFNFKILICENIKYYDYCSWER